MKTSRQQRYRNHRHPSNKSKQVRLYVTSAILAFLLGIICLISFYAITTPEITQKDLEGSIETKIYDRNDKLITEMGGENREIAKAKEVPEMMKAAIISIEDQRFYSHWGIDPIRIAGAALSNIKSRAVAQGGSTITQQLVKLSKFSTNDSDKTIKRKIQEAILALKIEREYTKEEILTLYLNKVYLANNIYGVKTAADYYYNKPLKDLSLAQTAMIAGMPQAPNNYDPYQHPEESTKRRNLVLSQMLKMKFISQADYEKACKENIKDGLVSQHEHEQERKDLINDSFIQVLIDEVKEETGLDVYKDGLVIKTTMDQDLQEYLYNIVNSKDFINYSSDALQNAVTILDTKSGGVKAILGGRRQKVLLGYNRATQLERSVGSTIKPLTSYGPAIEYLNYSTGHTVVDEPYKYSSGIPIHNWDKGYMGPLTIRDALSQSRNIPALKVFQDVGTDNIEAFLKKLDINLKNDGANGLVEANAITGEISPIKLAAAYRAFANQGNFQKPYTVKEIITREGQKIRPKHQDKPVLKSYTAYMITDMLKDVFKRGTASNINRPDIPQAGKTGTTNYTDEQATKLGILGTPNVPDSWFVGYTTKDVISVWTGYDSPFVKGHSLDYADQEISKEIYKYLMNFLTDEKIPDDWKKPHSVVKEAIAYGSQPLQLAGPYTPSHLIRTELFVRGHLPKTYSYLEPPEDPFKAPVGLAAEYDPESQKVTISWAGTGPKDMTYSIEINGQKQDLDQSTSVVVNNIKPGMVLHIKVTAKTKKEGSSSAELNYTVPEEKPDTKDKNDETTDKPSDSENKSDNNNDQQ